MSAEEVRDVLVFEDGLDEDCAGEDSLTKLSQRHKKLRQKVAENWKLIEERSSMLTCPLLARECRGKQFRSRMHHLQAIQMKLPSMASDGNLYDFKSICKWIQSRCDTRITSPLTGKDMSPVVVYYVRSKTTTNPNQEKSLVKKIWSPYHG